MPCGKISKARLHSESSGYEVFIDDLVVFSDTSDNHQRHLAELFDALSLESLYLHAETCHISQCFKIVHTILQYYKIVDTIL